MLTSAVRISSIAALAPRVRSFSSTVVVTALFSASFVSSAYADGSKSTEDFIETLKKFAETRDPASLKALISDDMFDLASKKAHEVVMNYEK